MKTFLVIAHEEQDEGAVIKRMTASEIIEYSKGRHNGDFAVIDGNVVKGFDSKLYVARMKETR